MTARPVLLLVLVAFLVACGEKPAGPEAPPGPITEYGADPQAVAVQGAPALIRPPAGAWRVQGDTVGEGQTFEQYEHPDGGCLLRVLVFPVQAQRNPAAVLPRAIDRFLRGFGTEGFGQTQRGTEVLLGAPMAWSRYAAVVGSRRVQGYARLLLADPGTWVLAIGHVHDGAPGGRALQASIASLAPAEPVFYARSFQAAWDLEQVVERGDGESSLTLGDLMAVQLFIEAGLGTRYPLVVRPTLHAALRDEVVQGGAAARASFRGYRDALRASREMAPQERAAGMQAQGRKILQALLQRVPEGHAPAVKIHAVWQRMRQRAVGTEEGGVDVGALRCLTEMSAFFASIAADREVKPEQSHVDAVQRAVQARYVALSPQERAALGKAGAAWAALRYAWDHATSGARRAFRRAVLEQLVPEADRAAVRALEDDAAVLRWMHAHAEAQSGAYVLAAAGLPAAERDLLIDALGVPDAFGYHLGW